MKYFTINKNGIITPKEERYNYYLFDFNELSNVDLETNPMLLHLCHKKWVTKEMFFDLVDFAKLKFPDVNYTKLIFKAGKIYSNIELFEGDTLDRYLWLRNATNKITYTP